MTEPTLFRKVFCKDKLPDKGGEYHTNKGKDIFILISEEWEWDKYFVKASEWWLEPVQDPINKIITNLNRILVHCQEPTTINRLPTIRRLAKQLLELLNEKP